MLRSLLQIVLFVAVWLAFGGFVFLCWENGRHGKVWQPALAFVVLLLLRAALLKLTTQDDDKLVSDDPDEPKPQVD